MSYQQLDLTARQLIGSIQEVATSLVGYASGYPLYTFAGAVVLGALVVITIFPRVSDYR